MKKGEEKKILKAVTAIRRRNNILWMHIFKVAIKDPGMKKVVREIVANDKEVVRWMKRIQ